jgi:cytochrome bd-type quinol oxidase subunit 2
MSDPVMDEVEALLKSERRRQGRERFGLVTMVAGMLIAGLTLMFKDAEAISIDQVSTGLMIAAAIGVAGALMILLWKRGASARRLEGLIGRRDRLQRVRNDRIYATSITGWGLVAVSLPALSRIAQGQADGSDIGLVAAAAMSPLFVVMSVAGWGGLAQLNRRWLEDEVTRDIRRRALSLGFLVLMTAVTGLFILSLWEQDRARTAFPAVLMLAASVAGLRFVWLDQQAEDADLG